MKFIQKIQEKTRQLIDTLADGCEKITVLLVKGIKAVYTFTKEAWQIAIPLYLEIIVSAYFFSLMTLGQHSNITALRYGITSALCLMLWMHLIISYHIVMKIPAKAQITDRMYFIIAMFNFLRDMIYLFAGALIGVVTSLYIMGFIK